MHCRPSPFPGLDPYLSDRWGDIGLSVLVGLSTELNRDRLPDRLIARTDRLDVWVNPRDDPIRDRWLYIFDHRDHDRVVTHVELLRPDNRTPGPSHDAYVERLKSSVAAGINVVEIDLHRCPRATMPRWVGPGATDVAGLIATCRAPGGSWDTQLVPLRSAVPPVIVPLRPGDADLTLDVQSLLDRAYLDGGHDDIDYAIDPDPPLSGEDAAWADALLRAAGRRP